jgi:hypothetical protein
MDNEEMWNKLFERVDSFKTKLEPTETDAKDAFVLAFYGFSLWFWTEAMDHPREARISKDGIVRKLQRAGLSRERLEDITELLITFCDLVENENTQ